MSVHEAHGAEILDRLPAGGWAAERPSGLRRYTSAVWHWLPKGQLLPEHIWRRRHAAIVWLLWLHVPALVAFGLFQGYPVLHMLQEGGLVAAAAWFAASERFSMTQRVVAASFGLMFNGMRGSPEFCSARCASVILAPLRSGIRTPSGRYF